jgi:citrate lyase beta subunit/acyl dehydratase
MFDKEDAQFSPQRIPTVVPRGAATVELFRSVFFIEPTISSRDALELKADCLIFDCLPHMSWDRAEHHANNILGSGALGHSAIYARMPSLQNSKVLERALKCWVRPEMTGLVVAGFKGGADVQEFERKLTAAERKASMREGTLKLICLVDCPEAVRNVARIVRSSSRVKAVSLVHADAMARRGGRRPADVALLNEQDLIGSCRKVGVTVIGAPVIEQHATEEVERECLARRNQGYGGVFVLGARQIETVHNVFGKLASTPKPKPKQELSGSYPKVTGTAQRRVSDITIETPAIAVPAPVATLKSADVVRGGLVKPSDEKVVWTKGEIRKGLREVTIDSSMVALWNASVGTSHPYTLSVERARAIGASDRLIPHSLLMNLTLGVCGREILASASAELGVQEVYYEKAACIGDTLRGALMVQDIRKTAQSARSVVKSRLVLFNQNDERIFSLTLLTAHINLISGEESKDSEAEAFAAAGSRELLSALLTDPERLPAGESMKPGQLILHRNVGTFEDIQTHSLRSVSQIDPWNESQRARSEFPLQVSLGMSLTEHELGGSVHEILEYAAPVHRSDSRENLGVISYVLEVEPLGEHFEVVRIKTLALRGIAPAEALVKVDLPKSLFELGPQKPSDYDKICQKYATDLMGKIAWQAVRRLVRPRS